MTLRVDLELNLTVDLERVRPGPRACQFMYLGVAPFYQERINKFLNVAKTLEVKEISKDVELIDDNVNDQKAEISDTENVMEPESYVGDSFTKISDSNTQVIQESLLQKNKEGVFECNQCDSQLARIDSLERHIQSKHNGVKHPCHQCDKKFSDVSHLRRHIQSKHEGVRYACNQCSYEATQKVHLLKHIQSKHESQ